MTGCSVTLLLALLLLSRPTKDWVALKSLTAGNSPQLQSLPCP